MFLCIVGYKSNARALGYCGNFSRIDIVPVKRIIAKFLKRMIYFNQSGGHVINPAAKMYNFVQISCRRFYDKKDWKRISGK